MIRNRKFFRLVLQFLGTMFLPASLGYLISSSFSISQKIGNCYIPTVHQRPCKQCTVLKSKDFPKLEPVVIMT